MKFVLIGAGVVVLACPCLGIVSAITIPNFIRFQARARQAECNINLKSLYTGLMVGAEGTQGAELTFAQVRFAPERGNRYSYFLGSGPMEDRSGTQPQGQEQARAIGVDTFRFPKLRVYTLKDLPQDVASEVGVVGSCPDDCTFTVACAGDVDNDSSDTPDVWTVSNKDRTLNGERVPAGQPYNHVNDVTTD